METKDIIKTLENLIINCNKNGGHSTANILANALVEIVGKIELVDSQMQDRTVGYDWWVISEKGFPNLEVGVKYDHVYLKSHNGAEELLSGYTNNGDSSYRIEEGNLIDCGEDIVVKIRKHNPDNY